MRRPADFDVMSPKQRIDWFDKENGDDGIVIDDVWVVFSNGAMREANMYGALKPPPDDELELWRVQLRYRQKLVDTAANEFRTRKQQLMWTAEAGSTVLDEEKRRLRQLGRKVIGLRKQLTELEQQIEDHPRTQRLRQMEADNDERRYETLNEISKIRI